MTTTFAWNPALIRSVAEKQQKALLSAFVGESNVFGLSKSEVDMICKSESPHEICGIYSFLSASHQIYWEQMNSMSLEALTKKFENEIQNRRILKEILG